MNSIIVVMVQVFPHPFHYCINYSTYTHRLTKYYSQVPTTFPKFWGKKSKATTKVTFYEPPIKIFFLVYSGTYFGRKFCLHNAHMYTYYGIYNCPKISNKRWRAHMPFHNKYNLRNNLITTYHCKESLYQLCQ